MTTDIETTVTATLVADGDRLAFLPKFFGSAFLQAENMLFSYADRLCPKYNGGYWDYYTLSNGGFFCAHRTSDESVQISINTNGYEGMLNPQSAGVIVTMFTLSHLMALVSENGKDSPQKDALLENLYDHYYQLRDFISTLPDAREVWRAID